MTGKEFADEYFRLSKAQPVQSAAGTSASSAGESAPSGRRSFGERLQQTVRQTAAEIDAGLAGISEDPWDIDDIHERKAESERIQKLYNQYQGIAPFLGDQSGAAQAASALSDLSEKYRLASMTAEEINGRIQALEEEESNAKSADPFSWLTGLFGSEQQQEAAGDPAFRERQKAREEELTRLRQQLYDTQGRETLAAMPEDLRNSLYDYARSAAALEYVNAGGAGFGDTLLRQNGTYLLRDGNRYSGEEIVRMADSLRDSPAAYARLKERLEAAGYDPESLLDYVETVQGLQYAQESEKDYRQTAQEHPVLMSIASVLQAPFTLGGAADAAQTALYNAITGEERPVNLGQAEYMPARFRNTTRQTVAENIDSDVGRAAYNIGMSMADMATTLPMYALPGGQAATLAVNAGNAAADTAVDITQRGGTASQAAAGALAAGAAETVFDRFGLDSIFAGGNWSGVKGLTASLLRSAGVEGAEEAATELVNILADQAIMGDQSNYNQNVENYRRQGMTEEEARQAAQRDLAKQVGMAAAGGAIAGGLFGSAVQIPAYLAGRTLAADANESAGGADASAFGADASAFGADASTGTANAPIGTADAPGAAGDASPLRPAGAAATRPVYEGVPAADANARAARNHADVSAGVPAPGTADVTTPSARSAQLAGSARALRYEMPDMSAQARLSRAQAARESGAASGVEQGAVETAAQLAASTGRNIRFVPTLGEGINGRYDGGTNTIYIAASSRNPVETVLKHELTHSLEDTGGYTELRDYMVREIITPALSRRGADIAEAVQAKMAQYAEAGTPLTYDEALREIVADYSAARLFTDEAAIRNLSAKRPSLARRILAWIRSLYERVRDLWRTPEGRALRRAEQLYEEALRGPMARGEGAQYQINPDFAQEYDAWVKSGKQGFRYFRLGTTSEALESVGIPPASIYWDQAKIRAIQRKHPDMTDEVIKAVPGILENPMVIMQSLTVPNRVVVLGELADAAGGPVIAALELRPNGEIRDFVKVASAYGKSNLQNLLYSSDILYVNPDKNKTDSWLNTLGLQLPASLTNYGPIDSVTYANRDVNGNVSFGPDAPQKTAMQLAMERAGVVPADTSISEIGPEDTGRRSIGITNGDIDEEMEELIRRYSRRQETPLDVAQLRPQDASTTPPVAGSGADTGSGYTVPPVASRQGDGQSRFAESLQGASVVDERFKEMALEDIGVNTYDSITNRDTLDQANRALDDGGYRYVADWFTKSPETATAQDIAAGIILMSRYQAVGDYDGMVNAARKLRQMGTSAGQTVQMFSILGRMTPEGMVHYAQRSLDDAFEQMVKNRSRAWADKNRERFRLTDEDVEFILDKTQKASKLPAGRDKNILLGEIAARVQEKLPPEKGQNVRALARISMLLNPKTFVRNILGNVSITPVSWIDDLIGAGIDRAASRSTGVRTTGASGPSVRGTRAFLGGAAEAAGDWRRKINTRDIDADRFQIGQGGPSFRTDHRFKPLNALSKALNAVDRFTSFTLEAGDRPFFNMWFENSLNNQMKLNGVSEPTAAMIETARQDALARTWQDTNGYTRFVSNVKNALNTFQAGGYGLGDVFLKFTKTPANLTKALVDYSPAGLVRALASEARKFRQAVSKGEATPQMQRRFVNSLSKGITGSLLTAIFAVLAENGVLRGEGSDDPDAADFEENVLGLQPYSVKIGDKTYSYEWMQPIGGTAAIVSDIVQTMKEGDADEFFTLDPEANAIVAALQSGGQVLYDQSFMQSLSNLFESDNMVQNFLNGILAEPAVFVPQLSSQVARLTDDTARRSYVSGRPLDTAVNRVKAKIPGLRSTLEPVVDVLGREVPASSSPFDVFLNPANTSAARPTAAAEEMYRLYSATGDTRVIPPKAPGAITYTSGGETVKKTLTAEEKTEYQRITGQIAQNEVERLTESRDYAALTDEEKADLLADIYSYAGAVAKSELSDYALSAQNEKRQLAAAAGISLADYLLLDLRKDADGNGSVSQQEMRAALEESDFTEGQKAVLWKLQNKSWKFSPYRSQDDTVDEILKGALS